MTYVIARNVEGGDALDLVVDDDIHLQGKVDGNSSISLISRTGTITIDGKIDGGSSANLKAVGDIRIGNAGGAGDRKIDGGSSVTASSEQGAIQLDGKIDGRSRVTFTATGDIRIGTVGEPGDRKVDNNCTVVLTSLRGDVLIDGKIDENCIVEIMAGNDVEIGRVGAPGDRKIDNNCDVRIDAGGTILLGDKIDGHAVVDLRACGDITITNKIDGGAQVRMASSRGRMLVVDKVDGDAQLSCWPDGVFTATGGVHRATVHIRDWAGPNYRCLSGETRVGTMIRDWGWTFAYVTTQRLIPRSLSELVALVRDRMPDEKLKARGGGWSFGDGVLPFDNQSDVDRVSLIKRGQGGVYDFRRVLEGLGDNRRRAMDLQPSITERSYNTSKSYNQENLRDDVQSSRDLPSSDDRFKLIDTRGLASSLQTQLQPILSDSAREQLQAGKHYFWVEAGITIADLNIVLDHQHPRLAIQASGGSPGATLAGTLATATHGGEFQWPLLVDMVRAIHLVGPGGEEWWIEGEDSVADLAALQAIYPQIGPEHFIASDWRGPEGLTARDVLKSVSVSLGMMGVIYSLIIEVVPQYGLEQRSVAIGQWSQLLTIAGTSESELRRGDVSANHRVLDLLMDGATNGSGISREDSVYIDLAINPINRSCWIVNRRLTSRLPDDPNKLPVDFDNYFSAANQMMGRHAEASSTYHLAKITSGLIRRLHDFLYYGTSDGDIINNVSQLSRLLSFITSRAPLLSTALATLNVQAVLNQELGRAASRGQAFLGDLLDTVLHALQGTAQGQVSTTTGVAYQVGAIGWPNDGIPGRGLEIGLSIETAFTFLQKVIFDGVLLQEMQGMNKPLVGYISIRVCPQTRTMMGMQQFGPHSIMIELVGFRTPEANQIMEGVQRAVLAANQLDGTRAMLHWGLENHQLNSRELVYTAVDHRYLDSNPRLSQLMGFHLVKNFFLKDYSPVFDNNLVRRLFGSLHPLNANIQQTRSDEITVEIRVRLPAPEGFDVALFDHALVLLVEQDATRDQWDLVTRGEIVDGHAINVLDYQNRSFPRSTDSSGAQDDVGGTGTHRRLRLVNLRTSTGIAIQRFRFSVSQPDPDPQLSFYALVTAVRLEHGRAVEQRGGILATETVKIPR